MLENYWIAEQLVASEKELSSMEVVKIEGYGLHKLLTFGLNSLTTI
jgi:hypothetical protein